MNERIKRIQQMEEILDRLTEVVSTSNKTIDTLIDSLSELKELTNYYESIWINDHQADERNEIPKDLKRGVLSEDAVYLLLCDYRALIEKIQSIQLDI